MLVHGAGVRSSRRVGAVSRLSFVAFVLVAGASCGAPASSSFVATGQTPESVDSVAAYLGSPAFRRSELERSLVSTSNGYARRRLASYTESAWGALPEWNPPVAPARFVGAPSDEAYVSLGIPSTRSETELLELGRRAFVSYPLQLADYAEKALKRADAVTRYGLYEHEGQVGGLVRAKLADGSVHLALTCATCHAKPEGGRLVLGKTNDDLRIDLLDADASGNAPEPWGRGRVDVTADGVQNPTAITDLRPVRFQVNLHRAGTLRNGLVPLAIRIETLAITSLGETGRPPREIALGLALYVRSFGAALRSPSSVRSEGAHLFESHCARCHGGADLTGPAVPFEDVETDAAILLGPERTTGRARVPSLRGVALRSPLLSSGSVRTLDELLLPRAERPRGGHTFGQDLAPAEREKLLVWLRALD